MTSENALDLDETIDEIVRASSLPLSIIIVGIGNGEFQSLEKLDADLEPLWSKKYNKFSERDCCQFIRFDSFKNTPGALAREVLKEIPNQMKFYYQNKEIPPNPKK